MNSPLTAIYIPISVVPNPDTVQVGNSSTVTITLQRAGTDPILNPVTVSLSYSAPSGLLDSPPASIIIDVATALSDSFSLHTLSTGSAGSVTITAIIANQSVNGELDVTA